MRCASRRAKRADHERCAVQYPGLRSRPRHVPKVTYKPRWTWLASADRLALLDTDVFFAIVVEDRSVPRWLS